MATPVAPSGEQVELIHGDQRVVVVSGGGGLRSYTVGDRAVVEGYAQDEVCAGGRGQLLVPWPNRVRDGRYSFAGQDRQLDLTEPEQGHAIHGLVRSATWALTDRTAAAATLEHLMLAQPGYPHVLAVRVDYRLGDSGLAVTVTTTNQGDHPAPYGTGAHPYVRASLGPIDSCRLRVPAATRLVTDERQIPIGQAAVDGSEYDFRAPRTIGPMRLDTAYRDLDRDGSGIAHVELQDPESGWAVRVWMDAAHSHLMIFTGDTLAQRRRHGLGVEPMTCPPNALATGENLVVLEPGASHTASWGISPGRGKLR